MSVVIEERLAELFQYMPGSPNYFFGDDKEINSLITKMDGSIYPLIYQTSNTFRENSKDPRSTEADLVFVIATRNTYQMYNPNRWATSYKNVLRPIYENMKILFTKANIIASNYDYEVRTFPNYSETESKDKNKFIDIVDALEVRVTLIITNGCLNKEALNKIKTWD